MPMTPPLSVMTCSQDSTFSLTFHPKTILETIMNFPDSVTKPSVKVTLLMDRKHPLGSVIKNLFNLISLISFLKKCMISQLHGKSSEVCSKPLISIKEPSEIAIYWLLSLLWLFIKMDNISRMSSSLK